MPCLVLHDKSWLPLIVISKDYLIWKHSYIPDVWGLRYNEILGSIAFHYTVSVVPEAFPFCL